jgi:hypothetical protein
MAGIKYNAGINDYKGTPYAISDLFANLGNYTPNIQGALYFAIDGTTETILQADGSNWVPLAGAGAGFGTLQQVTNLGASTDNTLTLTGNGIYSDSAAGLYSLGNQSIGNDGTGFAFDSNISELLLGEYSDLGGGVVLHIDLANGRLYTEINGGVVQGIDIDFVNQQSIFGTLDSYLDVEQAQMITKIDGSFKGLSLNANTNTYKIGDYNNTNNSVYLFIDDDNNIISSHFADGFIGLKLDGDLGQYGLGDFAGIYNNEALIVKPDTSEIYTRGPVGIFGLYVNQNTFISTLGDYFNNNFNTWVNVDDNNQKIILNAAVGKYQFNNVRTYPNNAAAIAAGLAVGEIYKNGITGILSVRF